MKNMFAAPSGILSVHGRALAPGPRSISAQRGLMLTAYEHDNHNLVRVDASKAKMPKVVWIDLLDPTPEEDALVEGLLHLDIPSRAEMDEIELSDRLYHEGDAEFMTLTAVAKLDTEQPAKTPVTLILAGDALLTVRYADLKPFQAYLANIVRDQDALCANGELIMLGVISALIDRIADALEQIGNQVDAVARNVFEQRDASAKTQQHDLEVVIKAVGRKSELLAMLQESLVSIARVATFHSSATTQDPASSASQLQALIGKDAASLNAHAQALSGRLSFLLDATLGLINLQQNQIIKIVSVAALVFLPPTLVASIYGMNFHNMPELAWYYGYPLALGAMILTAVLPYLFFKRRGWL